MNKDSKRHEMVRWYDPFLLAKIGLRAAVSTAVGQVADNRQVHASLSDPPQVFDHSGDVGSGEDFWFDFVADLGDGWQSTNAVASVICQPSVNTDDEQIPRGSILIMGGDEIYPDPSIQGYQERTIDPWNHACADQEAFETTLYSVPGNHDWYDGLHAFHDVFCSASRTGKVSIGASFDCLKPSQTHSYFALKLKQDWWLCGIDIALNDRLDNIQINFFTEVAKQIKSGHRVILCAPTPSWVKEQTGETGATKLLDEVAGLLTENGGEMRLVLTGDVHHYARYGDRSGPLNLITAGGGGAFLHPTHMLPETVIVKPDGEKPESFDLQKQYPASSTSAKLTWQNLLFPWKNRSFAVASGLVYVLLVWFLETRSLNAGDPMGKTIIHMMESHISITDTLLHFFSLIPRSPEFAIIVALVAVALIGFNVTHNRLAGIAVGLAHTLLHITGLVFAYCMAILFLTMLPDSLQVREFGFVFFVVTLFITGSILGGMIFGIYLIFALNVLGWQWTNAFSSLRIADYKNFLRLKLDAAGNLTVYAIGINKVAAKPLKPHLIEKIKILK